MYHWTEYAQTNAQPRPLSDKKDFKISPLVPELEPREVQTLGLHHPVFLLHFELIHERNERHSCATINIRNVLVALHGRGEEREPRLILLMHAAFSRQPRQRQPADSAKGGRDLASQA